MPSAHLTYLAAIERESSRFLDVLAGADPTAQVPACPDWTAADLLWHLTEVQGFWGWIIRNRPATPDDYPEPVRATSYAEQLTAYDRARAGLVGVLAEVDPSEPAWSWASEQTTGFTFRRQAHEALIHRLDAEETAGAVTPLDRELAADGVLEALEVMLGGCPPWATFTPGGERQRLVISDTGTDVVVELGRFAGTSPHSGKKYDEPTLVLLDRPADAHATLRGPAAVLDTWLWRRGNPERLREQIEVEGDHGVYERFRAIVDQPIE